MAFDPNAPFEVVGGFDPSQPFEVVEPRTKLEAVKDTAIDLGKGIVGYGESLVGAADILTGNAAGKGLSYLGFDPKKTKEILSSRYSPARQVANENVANADGFVDTLGALVDNPAVAFGTIVESAPMSLAGVAAARFAATKMLGAALGGVEAGTPKAVKIAAKLFADPKVRATLVGIGASAEGVQAAGSIQETGRQEGRAWQDTVAPAVAAGIGTATIGAATSKIPGFRDAEATLATAGLGARRLGGNLLASGKEIAKSMFKEGWLEELPQSMQEQIFTNLALDKPWNEGVGAAGAQGAVAGMGQGGGMAAVSEVANGLTRRPATEPPPPAQEPPVVEQPLVEPSPIVEPEDPGPAFPPPKGPLTTIAEKAISREQQAALDEAAYQEYAPPLPGDSPTVAAIRYGDQLFNDMAATSEDVARQGREKDLSVAFSNPDVFIPKNIRAGLAKMEADLVGTQGAGLIEEGEGMGREVVGRFPATTPQWIKQKTLEKIDARDGLELSKILNQKTFAATIAAKRAGKPLTANQSTIWNYIKKTAVELPETADDEKFNQMQTDGLEPVFGNLPAGKLTQGDEIEVGPGSIAPADRYKVEGWEDGQIVLQDGVRVKVDPWDTLNVEGRKATGEELQDLDVPFGGKRPTAPTDQGEGGISPGPVASPGEGGGAPKSDSLNENPLDASDASAPSGGTNKAAILEAEAKAKKEAKRTNAPPYLSTKNDKQADKQTTEFAKETPNAQTDKVNPATPVAETGEVAPGDQAGGEGLAGGVPAAAAGGVEPWQQTKAEYVDGHYRSPGMHREGVRLALERGEQVPDRVLADYPDLQGATKAQPGESAIPYPKTIDELDVLPEFTVYRTGNDQRPFAVRSGMKRGMGDTLHKTMAEAALEKKMARRQSGDRALREEKSRVTTEAEADKKAINAPLSIAERRANAVIDKPHNLGGIPSMTRRELTVWATANGYTYSAKEKPNEAAKKKDEEIIARARKDYLLNFKNRDSGSNKNIPAVRAAYEAYDRMEAGYPPTLEYRLNTPEGSFFGVTKTEYDLAQKSTQQVNKNPETFTNTTGNVKKTGENDNMDRPAMIARRKELLGVIRPLAAKGDLTANEGAQYNALTEELHELSFDLTRPISADKIGTEAERQSTLSADVVLAAHGDLMRDRDIYRPIVSAAAGVSLNADTAVDDVMNGKNKTVTPQQFYDAFAGARDAMRKQYGETVKLYRATGKQKDKATTNWATTEEYARQFGDKIISRDIPVDDVIAVNVGTNGKYHEIIIGTPPVKQASNKETTAKQEDAASDMQSAGLQSSKPASEMTASELLRAAADKMDATDKPITTPIKWQKPARAQLKDEWKTETLDTLFFSGYPTKEEAERYREHWLSNIDKFSSVETVNPKDLAKQIYITDSSEQLAKNIKHMNKDVPALEEIVSKGNPFMPILIRKDGSLRVLGGRTRMSLAGMAGQNVQAVVIDEAKMKDVFYPLRRDDFLDGGYSLFAFDDKETHQEVIDYIEGKTTVRPTLKVDPNMSEAEMATLYGDLRNHLGRPYPAKEYKYAMVNRPYGIGTAPKDGFVRTESRPEGEHHDYARNGVAVYNRELTDAETKQFEMAPMANQDQLAAAADMVAKSMGRYAAQYAEMAKTDSAEFERTVMDRLKSKSAGYPPSVGDTGKFAELVAGRLTGGAQGVAADKPERSQAEREDATAKTDLDFHNETMARIHDGEATLAEYKAGFQRVIGSKEELTVELSGMTKQQLLDKIGGMYAYRMKGEKKDRIIRGYYDDMLIDFWVGSGLFSYGMDGMLPAMKKAVNATIYADLEAHAEKVKASRAERKARTAQMGETVKDPKTLEDFITFIRAKKAEGKTFAEARMAMTQEQQATFDELSALKSRKERGSRKEESRTQVRAAGATTGAEIIATKHTRDGYDLFVVKAEERVEREVYNEWNAAAKKMGGWYSKFRGDGAVPGFQFKTREAAEAFQKYVSKGDTEAVKEQAQARRDSYADDRSQTAVERLTEMADKLEERADASLNQDRKANTSRRAAQTASAEAAANSDKALAKTMRNIAGAIEGGTAQFLDRVRQKSQVEMLRAFTNRALYAEQREKYPEYRDYEQHKGESPTASAASFVEFPQYTAYRSDLARLGRELEGIEGAKKIGAAVLKVADDISDAYLTFAKENLHKVSTFSKKDGSAAVFKTRAEAEGSIQVSGHKGNAIVVAFKRGQNMIIMSPSLARERGVWEGDDDKRITITNDAGAEIVAKVKAMGRRVSMPYIFENVRDEQARLAGMGIETPAELRAAVREFIALREAPKAPDKVKELERAMVGRVKDGLDFFPTPEGVAQDMIEAAGIEPGMSVLEPSAGMGHIAEKIREAGVDPDVVEMSGKRKELLEAKGFNVVGQDFMDSTEQYDRIIMNPPFSNRRDAEHVQHAYSLLKPGGRLVAIMGEGVFFGQDKKAQAFREWLDSVDGTAEKLEEGTFLDPSLPVNTGTNARMVVVDKGGAKLYSRTNKTEWPDDFPNATTHTTLVKLKAHPDYDAAKAGDVEAAFRVVSDLVSVDKIKAMKKAHPSAIVVAPHAIEVAGKNAIPQVLAEEFGNAGFEVDTSIVQTNEPHRTKKDSPLRLALRPEFSGEVKAGREYILIDDAIGQGGTIAELRFFIESQGGKVANVSALTSGIFGNKLSIRSETVTKLEEKFGREKLEKFLHEFNTAGRIGALTEKEGRFVLRQPSLNSLRDRILADAQEAGISPSAWQAETPLSRLASRSTTTGTTVAQVETELRAFLKKGYDRLVALGKLKIVQSETELPGGIGLLNMVAYHGSPHRFDKFSTDHIGNGEGAQVYGHGLYFASSRDVAEHYRKTLSPPYHKVSFRGEEVSLSAITNDLARQFGLSASDAFHLRAIVDVFSFGDLSKARKVITERIEELKKLGEFTGNLDRRLAFLDTNKDAFEAEKPGSTYQVELAPKSDDYLLWDKPLSEQSEKVKAALAANPDFAQGEISQAHRGSDLYRYISEAESDKAASEYLHSLGIRGIKYLDGASRTRPIREIKAEFLAELPEDATMEEVEDLIGTGKFSPKNDALLKALAADDWLGFSYPAQAISAALGNDLANYDASPALLAAVADAKEGGTHNFVIFSDEDVKITALYSKDGSIAGTYDPRTGQITLVADTLKEGGAKYVMLHEGGHALMREDPLFAKQYDAILAQIKRAKRYDYRVQDAYRKVPDDTPAHQVDEEALMYFIEAKSNHTTSLFKKIIANVRAWLFRMGIPMKNLTTDDLVAMVTQGVRRMASQATREETSRVGGTAPALYSKEQIVEAAKVSGEELGQYNGIHELWKKARDYGKTYLAEKTFENAETGFQVLVPWQGIKHTLPSAKNEAKMLSIVALPEMIRDGHLISKEKDAGGRAEIKAVYKFDAPLTIKGEPFTAHLVVREHTDGKRYYNHALSQIEKATGIPGDRGSSAERAGLSRPAVASSDNNVSPGGGNVKSDGQMFSKVSLVSLENLEEVAKTMGSITVKKRAKVDSTFLDRIFSTPEYYFKKFEAAGRVLQAALLRRDVRFTKEQEILGKEFVGHVQALRKNNREAYDEANNYLIDRDQSGEGFSLKEEDETWKVVGPDGKMISRHDAEQEAVAAMVEAESAQLAKDGYSPDAIHAVKLARELTNRGFDVMAADMRKIIEEAKKAGLPNPLIGDGAIDEAGRYGIYGAHSKKPVALFATEQQANEAMARAAQMISYVVQIQGGGERSFMSEIKANAWAKKHSGSVNGRKTFDGLTVRMRTDVEMRPLTVQQALAQMGDMRGTYFPRIRKPGEYVLIAKKDGENPIRKSFDLPMVGDDKPTLQKLVNMGTPMGREAMKLKAQGYDVTMGYDESPVDDMFSGTNLTTTIDAILQDSMAVIDKNNQSDIKAGQQINQLITMQVADIFKARGYLSSRLKRMSGDTVWEGYETDMGKALTQYGKGIAAGTAKRDTARAMVLAFSGRDYSWDDYKQEVDKPVWSDYQEIVEQRRIDPRRQKNLFVDVRAFMIDVLRNDEKTDRIIGTMKGLAVLKFLAFRVSSAAVNATNILTGVPATLSGHAGISLGKAGAHVGKAVSAYAKYRTGKGEMSETDRGIFREITDRGWDDAQFNQEAARELRGELGEAWNKIMTAGMFMFGAVEKANRATTIFAAYKAMAEKHPDLAAEQIWTKAKEVSDRAHGVYGKETRPAWTRGGDFNRLLALPYTFAKFSHNYMLNMIDLGYNKREYQAAAYLLLSPAILSGAGATLATPALMALASALGIGGDDPEEEYYKWAEETFGTDAFARHGLAGLAGINLKGSLQIHNPMPTKLSEVFGAPGAIVTDTWKAIRHLGRGEFGKGAEALLPTAFGSAFKATREATEGITTSNYGQVFYGDEPLKADNLDAALRFFSFNPARLSGIREKQWNEKEVKAKYQARQKEIYAKIKRLDIQGKGITPEINKEIVRYNELVAGSGRSDIHPITPKKIRLMLKMNSRASKFERDRAVNE